MEIIRHFRNNLLQKCAGKLGVQLVRKSDYEGQERVLPASDHVRALTLHLVSQEINSRKLAGDVAELGVYRGDFARLINSAFPMRKLYLFDTFEGFSSRDIDVDQSGGFSSGSQDFSTTNVKLVLDKMPYPENCLFRKGYFPETAVGIESQFAFVSIDTDLYQPIAEGLKFFYPRLVPGGYIFVHDYNNKQYKGAGQAVREFCSDQKVPFVPIADAYGTAVIMR